MEFGIPALSGMLGVFEGVSETLFSTKPAATAPDVEAKAYRV